MNLGEIIRKMRITKGLTQKALADKLGKTPQYVSKLEKSTNSPNISTLSRLAAALDVGLSDLLVDDNMPSDWEDYANDNGIAPPNDFDGTQAQWFKAKMAVYDDGMRESSSPEYYLEFSFSKLNNTGKWEAVKRVSELTEIKKYTDED